MGWLAAFGGTQPPASKASLPDLSKTLDYYSRSHLTLPTTPESSSTSSRLSPSSSADSLSQPATPPTLSGQHTMPASTSPIDIATPSRNASSSPSSQGTKIGHYPGAEDSRTSAMMTGGLDARGRQESFTGAKPISMNNPGRHVDNRPRRESMAGSLVGGMSWGGVSVGSWIRDDIIMTGTSPFPYQSPSYHSSSYLPKLEANFMRDFSCCGKNLPTLHDLLQHYEECHAQQTPQSLRAASAAQQARDSQQPNSRAAIASQAATSVQQQAQQPQRLQQQQQTPRAQGSGMKGLGQVSGMSGGFQQTRPQQNQHASPTQPKVQQSEDMDAVEDMEMDDAVGAMDPIDSAPDTPVQRNQPQQMFGQRPQLSLQNSGGMIHQGLRNSQPTTPSTSGFGFQNNPTVSSVNTPTLSTQNTQGGTFTPDTSVPGTPAELDEDFPSGLSTNNMSMNNMNMNMNMNLANMNMFGFGGDLGLDLCIDEPAKRLYSPNGGFGNNQRALQAQFAQFGLGNNQFNGMANSEELMRRFRQQQLLHQMQGMGNMGSASAAMMMGGEEHKPFRCPVIGCEKAYKNQNGLKYHKTHGHQTQQLHENGDGTFSIVNPETSAPYPGTLGMEKEKPYKCEVCGKRYKNLNGLKYHKQHSPPCNPELKLNGQLQAAGLGSGLGMNVSGLPGIGEEGIM